MALESWHDMGVYLALRLSFLTRGPGEEVLSLWEVDVWSHVIVVDCDIALNRWPARRLFNSNNKATYHNQYVESSKFGEL